MTRTAAIRQTTASVGAASICAAVLGWLTMVLVGRGAGPAAYASFAVLWAAFYGMAGVFAGLQQEVTRSSAGHAPPSPVRSHVLLLPALLVGSGLTLVVAAAAPWWTDAVGLGWAVVAWLCSGLLGLTVLVTLSGALAAAGEWRLVSALLVADPLVRLGSVALVVATNGSGASFAAAVASGGWGWVVLLMAPAVRRALAVRGSTTTPAFLVRAGAGMVSTGCAGLLVSGYPFLLALTARAPLTASSAGLLAALVLLRSPVLVIVYGYRPVILSALLTSTEEAAGQVRRAWLVCAGLGVAAMAVGSLAGPWLVHLFFGSGFDVTWWQAAVFLANGALLTMLIYSGLALVAADAHGFNTVGWLIAVVGTTAALLLPLSNETRLACGLLAGPLLALAWHGYVWRWRAPAAPRRPQGE